MAKRKTTTKPAAHETFCPVEPRFNELAALMRAADATEKRADDFYSTAIMIGDRMDAVERYAAALEARSHIGGFLQVCLIRSLVQDLADEFAAAIHDEQEKHCDARALFNRAERKIVAMLYSVRQRLYAHLDGTTVNLEDVTVVGDYYMGDANNPHRIITDAVVAAAS